MPVIIRDSPLRSFASTSHATPSSSSNTSPRTVPPSPSPPSSPPSSPLIKEKFLPPNSSKAVWIRIKGYTNHLSPIGQKYAREQLPHDRVGAEADHYRETLLKDSTGTGIGGLILKVEALKQGKVLAVVNTRLSKEEEEVYNTFKRERDGESGESSELEEEERRRGREGEPVRDERRTTREPSSSLTRRPAEMSSHSSEGGIITRSLAVPLDFRPGRFAQQEEVVEEAEDLQVDGDVAMLGTEETRDDVRRIPRNWRGYETRELLLERSSERSSDPNRSRETVGR